MRILFLDLASHSTISNEGACIACVDETHTKAIHFIDERIDDSELMPVLEETLASSVWTYNDIGCIACVTGPGGFTSLRMAASLANVLSDQLRVPAAEVHLSDVYAARVTTQDTGHRTQEGKPESWVLNPASFLWLHSTKATQMFVKGFGEFASLWKEPTLITLDDLVQKVPGETFVAGEIIPAHEQALREKHVKRLHLSSIEDALPGLLGGLEYKKELLKPWYGRGW